MRRVLLVLLGTLAALLAVPSAAEAGQVGMTLGIQGAGVVVVVEGSLEDGASDQCKSTDQNDDHLTWCPRVRNSEPFEAWVWLRPFPSSSPRGHWVFDHWDGCDETRVRDGYTECAVHSGAFSSDERRPVVVFQDVVAPTVSGPTAWANPGVPGRFRFEFTVSEGEAQCRTDSSDWFGCVPPYSADFAPGDHRFWARGVDASGNAGEARSADFSVVDTVIDSGPPAVTNARQATFDVRSLDGTQFLCSLDGPHWSPCGTGPTAQVTYADLADGEHTFSVAARKEPWVDLNAATRRWVVDTLAPRTELTSAQIDARTARFTFPLPPDATQTTCRLSGASEGSWASCTSPVAYADLADGSYRFEVRAHDAAGNVQAEPSAHAWRVTTPAGPAGPDPAGPDPAGPDPAGPGPAGPGPVPGPVEPATGGAPASADGAAPQTTVAGGPGAWSLSSGARFTLGSSEPGGLRCTLDGQPRPCSPGALVLTRLAATTHVLEVAAVDAAGNTDPTPAVRTWTVPRTARQLAHGRAWRLRGAPAAYGGRMLEARRKRAALTVQVADARRLALVVSGGRRHGSVAVWVGKRKLATVRLAGRRPVSRRLVQLPALHAPFTGAVRLVVTTRGRPVRIEGVGVATR